MLISIKNNLAFLAMAKTASTAIEAALAPHCDIVFGGPPEIKHMPIRKFDRFIRPYLHSVGRADVETMCVIREPEDWLRSWFRYRSRPALDGKSNSTAAMSFDDFVLAYLSDPQPPFARLGRPATFIGADSGRHGIDHLFAYEAMDAISAFLEKRFGHRVMIERLNSSPNRDAGLSANVRTKLAEAMAIDYDLHSQARRK